MSESKKPGRLSESVVAGVDYAEKVKLDSLLDCEVELVSFDIAEGDKQFAKVNRETGEVEIRDYLNVTVRHGGHLRTFSTGAIPIGRVLGALQAKLDGGEVELPLLATFSKQGKTYVVS